MSKQKKGQETTEGNEPRTGREGGGPPGVGWKNARSLKTHAFESLNQRNANDWR